MPGWLVQALTLLGVFSAGTAVGGDGIGGALQLGDRPGTGIGQGIGPFGLFPSPGEPSKKRRRRRRALTASDKADIGFIVGLLGPGAGKQFATTLAARPR